MAKNSQDESKIIEITTKMVNNIIAKTEYELVKVEYIYEDNNWVLRFYINKQGGITINELANISRRLSKMLDKEDPIKESYLLEVSSPGIDNEQEQEV